VTLLDESVFFAFDHCQGQLGLMILNTSSEQKMPTMSDAYGASTRTVRQEAVEKGKLHSVI
jgi:hypothetical protein